MLHRRKSPVLRNSRSHRSSRWRRGILTIEMLMVLPILVIVLMAVFEFSILFFARSSVVQASRLAARQASLGTISQEELEQIVSQVLSPTLQRDHEVYLIPATRAGEVLTVGLRVPMSSAAPDLLWPVGFSLKGRYLAEETSLVRE